VDCERFQAELPDLLYGELDAEAQPEVEGHLEGCSSCQGLTEDLRAVRQAVRRDDQPDALAARIKLAARDELLAGRRGGGGAARRGGPIHLVALVVLGLCVLLAGFGLGVAWERQDPREDDLAARPEPTVRVPAPDEVGGDEPDWVGEFGPDPAIDPAGRVPRAPEAWQRVLFDAASGHQRRGDLAAAREFYARSVAVCPEGPLAAAAWVGAAEVELERGEAAEARRILAEVRVGVQAGHLPGGPRILQRIAELEAAAGTEYAPDGGR